MAPSQPFEHLRTRLRAAGVPARRVQCLIGELSDHVDDLIARGVPLDDTGVRRG
jgi:hypothetical protein